LAAIPPEKTRDPARERLVRAVLTNPRLGIAEGLRGKGPLQVYLIGQRLHGSSEETLVPVGFRADEKRTALADAVQDLLLQHEETPPAAVVLMTDGRDNASRL